MRAAVTGASGFIGRILIENLLADGWNVTVLSRRALQAAPAGKLRHVIGDLCEAGPHLTEFLRDNDVLFHCAGELYRPAIMEAVHVGGTRNLLAAIAEQVPATRPHWIQLSSVGAYGPPQNGAAEPRVITESTPPYPIGPYETTKTRADELVLTAGQAGLITQTIVRPANVFGEAMTNQSLRALLQMIRRGLFFYIGEPGAITNYVHVEDVVAALLACARNPNARDQIYNLSNDCTLEGLAEESARAFDVRPPLLRVPERAMRMVASLGSALPRFPLTNERINALVNRTRYPSDKIERELGIKATISVASRALSMLDIH
ncbi:NAD-dependent epimerase/dehydratase family protein [Ralstonia sp.]|uniref:NAD-dependent epimerase/dehydratase family protein n=1 Tax=Ralstonia sp. TaxID=54061 RepID=UPI0031CDC406